MCVCAYVYDKNETTKENFQNDEAWTQKWNETECTREKLFHKFIISILMLFVFPQHGNRRSVTLNIYLTIDTYTERNRIATDNSVEV